MISVAKFLLLVLSFMLLFTTIGVYLSGWGDHSEEDPRGEYTVSYDHDAGELRLTHEKGPALRNSTTGGIAFVVRDANFSKKPPVIVEFGRETPAPVFRETITEVDMEYVEAGDTIGILYLSQSDLESISSSAATSGGEGGSSGMPGEKAQEDSESGAAANSRQSPGTGGNLSLEAAIGESMGDAGSGDDDRQARTKAAREFDATVMYEYTVPEEGTGDSAVQFGEVLDFND